MGSGASAPEKPLSLALVGLGSGNAFVIRTLADKKYIGTVFNVTVFDKKDAVHHNMAAPRALVEPDFVDKQYWDHKYFKEMVASKVSKGVDVETAFVIHSGVTVTSVTTDTVTATNAAGEDISATFDQCVIGTGSQVPFPGKSNASSSATARAQYKALAKLCEEAKSIVIVGGGPTGIEVAGELGYVYGNGKGSLSKGKAESGKSLTLIHSHDTLLSKYDSLNPKVAEMAAKKLQAVGVELALGKRANIAAGDESKGSEEAKGEAASEEAKAADALPSSVIRGPVTVELQGGGKTFEADLVLMCSGHRINSDAYATSLAAAVDASGKLQVNAKLQVKGHEGRIWAVGDCNSIPGDMAYVAGEQGKYLGKALAAFAVGKGATVKDMKAMPNNMVITVGPKDGAGVLFGKIVGKFLIPKVKGKDFFEGQMHSNILGKFGKTK